MELERGDNVEIELVGFDGNRVVSRHAHPTWRKLAQDVEEPCKPMVVLLLAFNSEAINIQVQL